MLQTALAEAHPATEPEEITPLHRVLGDVAAKAGDPATAVRALSEAAVRLDRQGEVMEAVQARWRMSTALMAQGSVADGVAVLETLVEVAAADEAATEGSAGSPYALQLATQIRVDLAHGLLSLGEPRAAAVEYLRVADAVSSWPDQSRLTFAAAKAALALGRSDNWDGARAALERAIASNVSAPCVPELNDALRDLAGAALSARGADAVDEALGYLAQADRLRAEFPDSAREQFISVDFDEAQCACVRGRVLLGVERGEEALAEFERAIALYDGAGHQATTERFEVIRMAALAELHVLDRTAAAQGRLDAAIAEADAVGHADAASILRRLRAGRR